MSSNPVRWASFDAATDINLCWFIEEHALKEELRHVRGRADVATCRGIIDGFKHRAEDLMGLLVVVEASEITTSGLECLLRSNLTLPKLEGSTRESLVNAFLAERGDKRPTLTNIDISFRLVNLPPEVQTKIVEFAVYENRVISLGNCKGALYSCVTLRC